MKELVLMMGKIQINHEILENHMKVIMDDLMSSILIFLHKEAENLKVNNCQIYKYKCIKYITFNSFLGNTGINSFNKVKT